MNIRHRVAGVNKVIRLPELEAMTGRKRSSVYEDVANGRMPRQIKIGPRAVGWLRCDIESWLASRIAERDAETILIGPTKL